MNGYSSRAFGVGASDMTVKDLSMIRPPNMFTGPVSPMMATPASLFSAAPMMAQQRQYQIGSSGGLMQPYPPMNSMPLMHSHGAFPMASPLESSGIILIMIPNQSAYSYGGVPTRLGNTLASMGYGSMMSMSDPYFGYGMGGVGRHGMGFSQASPYSMYSNPGMHSMSSPYMASISNYYSNPTSGYMGPSAYMSQQYAGGGSAYGGPSSMMGLNGAGYGNYNSYGSGISGGGGSYGNSISSGLGSGYTTGQTGYSSGLDGSRGGGSSSEERSYASSASTQSETTHQQSESLDGSPVFQSNRLNRKPTLDNTGARVRTNI
ncbi:keratin, type I cytoskeletal 9-like [Oppia nitens]|uniref:keratin, type I cytoskeletal 9-like n=1 Tax=Oppia nitens TaxID=1686743 RepID=UPI0023DC4A23|nr:keratin, type I cytoskeletal 9-like [Oppia nitens]